MPLPPDISNIEYELNHPDSAYFDWQSTVVDLIEYIRELQTDIDNLHFDYDDLHECETCYCGEDPSEELQELRDIVRGVREAIDG